MLAHVTAKGTNTDARMSACLCNTVCNYMFTYSGILFFNYMMCLDLPHKITVLTGECVGHIRGQN